MSNLQLREAAPRIAVLDPAHVGDIEGALGTIYQGDVRSRGTWGARLATLAAIVGPGLIVMVGDNDAGAFSTYAQAGQNYGTTLLWTLLLLVPGTICQPTSVRFSEPGSRESRGSIRGFGKSLLGRI